MKSDQARGSKGEGRMGLTVLVDEVVDVVLLLEEVVLEEVVLEEVVLEEVVLEEVVLEEVDLEVLVGIVALGEGRPP